MAKSSHKYITWLLPTALIVSLLASFIAVPALANPGLSVSGAILVTDVSPGETLTHKMTISIDAKDSAADIAIQVGGMGQYLDGAYEMLEAPADTSGYSARQFITVDKASLHLEPGTSQNITATIHIPQDVGAGGRYAIVSITNTKPTGKEQVTILTGINVPIGLTVKDTSLVHQSKITELTTSEVVSGQPLSIFTTFQNTGNHHFKVKGKVTISNSQGEVLDTISMPLTASSIIPTMLRRLEATFTPKGALASGVYSIKSEVTLEDGTKLYEKEGSFEVKEPYKPPQTTPPTTQTAPPTTAPTTTPAPVPTTTPAPTPTPISWPVIGGAAAAIIIIALLIVLLLRRRR